MDQTQDQHPPMQGDDELAKALQGGLQFEETPVPGMNATPAAATDAAATDAPTLAPASPTTTDTMPDPMNDPALLADLPDLTSGLPAPSPAADLNAEPPTVHHTHTKGMVTPPALGATEQPAAEEPSSTEDEPAKEEPVEPTPAKDAPSTKEEHQHAKKGGGELDKLKSSALEELRPLVGKLNLPDDEKFDILLLIIRSTDDQALLNEAHDAAKKITDDGKRAQALLDIIKEIDYFSTKR